MDFVELTKRLNRDLHDSCDRGALQRLGRSMERAKGLEALLKAGDSVLDTFPAASMSKLAGIYREFEQWKVAAREHRRVLAQSKLSLPDGSLQNAWTPHELGALERTARMCPRAGFPDHDSWAKAVSAHVELWRACVEIGMADGSVAVTMAQPDHEDAEEFAGHVTAKTMLSEVRGYQWLGARRGERGGILEITVDVPPDRIAEQGEARLATLGLAAGERGAGGVLDELVRNDLDSCLRSMVDRRAEGEALETASNAYRGLLSTPPLEAVRVLAIHLSTKTAPAGLAAVDKNGDVVESTELDAGGDLTEAISKLMESTSPDTAVLPVSGDSDRLRLAEAALDQLPIARVLPAGLREARKGMDFSPMVAGAVVLARRAFTPVKEWSKVTPASLGLGEYSRDIDHDKLTAVLAEARAIALWEIGRKRRSGKGQKGGAVTYKRLNPLVRTIRDLKPGMSLDGVVTNLTRFGAFVNIGLSTEAMIHVSQLSTEFVDEPSQVVRVGQNVTARVLEVVPDKSRIALSLKPAPEEGERPKRDSGPPAPTGGVKLDVRNLRAGNHTPTGPQYPGQGGRDEPKKSRSEALADLDALFKK